MGVPVTIGNCLTTACTAVENDTATAAFLAAQYPGYTLTTSIGVAGAAPPDESLAPFVVFLPSYKVFNMGAVNELTPSIEVEWCLLDKRVSTVSPRTTYQGIGNIDEFGVLILNAIKTAFGAAHVRVADYQIDESTRHPLYQAGMSLTFWWRQGLGNAVSIGDI